MKKILVISLSLILAILLINNNITTVIGVVEENSYAVLGDNIYEYLNKEELESSEMSVETYEVGTNETIYEKDGKIYIGENRKEINAIFPIFSKQGDILSIVTNYGKLISNRFTISDVFPNILMAKGNLYQSSTRERLDNNTYILYKMENDLYNNLLAMEIETDGKVYNLPVNSIMKLEETKIKAFTLNGKNFTYRSVVDIDENSIVRMGENEYIYSEFLKKVNNISEKLDNSSNKVTDEEINEELEEEGIVEGAIHFEKWHINKDKTKESNKPDESDSSSKVEESNKDLKENDKESNEGYIKPEVKLADIDRGVYYLNPSFNINDEGKNIQYPLTVKVYQSGKLILKKSVTEEELDFTVSGLKPETKYTLKLGYSYIDENGDRLQAEITSSEVETKSADELLPISFDFENGDLYDTALEVRNLSLDTRSDEAKEAISKISILDGDDVICSLSSDEVSKLKNGETLETYITTGTLSSNKEVNLTIMVYDKYENELPVASNSIKSRTSKSAPKVNIQNKGNDFTTYTIQFKIDNNDKVEFENYRYEVVTEAGEVDAAGTLDTRNTTIDVENLKPNTQYYVRAYMDYDLDDNKGTKENNLSGELKIKTPPLSSAGAVVMKVDTVALTHDYMKIQLSLDLNKTNKKVLNYIDSAVLTLRGTETESITLSKEDIRRLKDGESLEFEFNNLRSSTMHYISMDVFNKASDGTETALKTSISNSNITTYRKDADVRVYNMLTSGTTAKGKVYIEDEDTAIVGGIVELNVYDEKNKSVYSTTLSANTEEDINITNLKEGNKYTMVLTASYYNITLDESNREKNKVLKSVSVKAEKSISGTLVLNELSEQKDGTVNINYSFTAVDTFGAVTENKLYIKQYKIDGDSEKLIKTYEYETVADETDPLGRRRTYSDNVTVNTEKGVYRFSLVADMYGSEIEVADSLKFTVNRSAKAISTIDDIKKINEDSTYNYLIVKDLDLSKEDLKITEEVTGIVDFDGHKITLNARENTYNALISNVGEEGQILNVRLELKNYDKNYNGKYGLVQYSYGTIRNVQVEFSGTATGNINNTSAICGENYGTIENFIIELENNSTATDGFGLATIKNYGTVKNGYLYGDASITVDKNSSSTDRIIGGLIGSNEVGATVQNVYSYVAVHVQDDRTTKGEYIGNVIGKNLGEASYLYSDKVGNNIKANTGSTIGFNSGKTSNIYYYLNPNNSNKDTSNSYNQKIESVSLRNQEFLESLYSTNIFDVDFDKETLCYPTLKENGEFKFKQPSIEIPYDESNEKLSLVSTKVVSRTDSTATLQLVINNLDGTLQEINIPDLKVVSINTEKKYTTTTVTVEVEAEKYYESYSLESITYMKNGAIEALTFKNISFYCDFYRPISSVEDWNSNMLNKNEVANTLLENYSLESDLDFTNVTNPKTNLVVRKLKGNGRTISNLTLNYNSNNNGFIYKITDTLSGLNFDNITVNTTANSQNGIIFWNLGDITGVNFTNVNINKSLVSDFDPERYNTENDILAALDKINLLPTNNNTKNVAPIVFNDKLVENTTISDSFVAGGWGIGGLVSVNNSYYGFENFYSIHPENYKKKLYADATLSNVTSTNCSVVATSGSIGGHVYSGGLVGVNFAKLRKVTVDNITVLSKTTRIGGVIGGNYYEYSDLGEVYLTNSFVVSNSGVVGGIASSSNSSKLFRAGAMNSVINGTFEVGGIIGNSDKAVLEKVFVNGGTIRGERDTGGIIGAAGSGSKGEKVSNFYAYTNLVSTTTNKIGMVAGALNKASSISNGFIGGTLKATDPNSGAIRAVGAIGEGASTISMTNILDYSNYEVPIASNQNYGIGNRLGKVSNYLVVETSKVNDSYYGNTLSNSVRVSELLSRDFYTNKLKVKTEDWSFSGLPQYMMKLVYNGGVISNQPDIPIPKLAASDDDENISTLSSFDNETEESLMDVYTVSANRINLELNNVDITGDLYYEIYNGDELFINEKVTNSTLTFKYDFVTPLSVNIKKGDDIIYTGNIDPSSISRKVLLQDSKYYYITSEGIKTNDGIISGDFVNIYKGYALTRTGDLVDITTREVVSTGMSGITSLNLVESLFKFTA